MKKLILSISFFCFWACLFVETPALNAQSESQFEAFQYRCVGPTRGGRATTVAGIASMPSTYYMGATGGGVWKTEDYGMTWKNVSDGYFESPSIGDINVAQHYPKIVYVGTGSDGIRSNVITGKGVYKSMDGGNSWRHIGLEKTGQIGAVEIHPYNPDVVFVAAIGQAFQANKERGVYRTKDGGQSWEKVLFLSDTVGIADLEFAPGHPDIIYATAWRAERKPWTIISGSDQDGIYKSTDGGDNWTKLENGLPEGIKGKIDLAVSPADENLLYALIEAPEPKGGLYRSEDQGETFKQVSSKKELVDRPFYYCNVEADPQNPNLVYVLSTSFWKSTDGGQNWGRLRPPHGDNHDMWINPNNPQLFIQCNDGGSNVTHNGGKTWSSQSNQPTAELYQVEVDDQYPYWLYAGQQDNSTIALPSLPAYTVADGPSNFWQAVGGCETGPAVPKPGNPDIVYSNCKGRFGVYNKKTGQEMQYYVGASNMYGHNPKDLKFRFQRVSPIHVSQHNPDVVYHTSQYVHKTTDDGKTWEIISPDLTAFEADKQVISGSPITRDITGEEFYSTIYAIQESKVQEGLIWVGANDGPVHVTRNGGKKWNKVTPKSLPPGGRVDCVEPSPHNPAKAYVAILRYQLGDWKPYIYKTENYGRSWDLLTDGTNGLPADFPTRVVREDPDREGVLYAGTEFGMFISLDDGKKWHAFQQNLPVTPITDIKVFRQDLILSTMGRSFWILDNVSSLGQDYLQAVSNSGKAKLFKPADAHRYRYRGSSSSSIPHYPSPSVLIDYYLPEEFAGEVQLEIVNSEGKVVRSFAGKTKSAKKEDSPETDMATGFRRAATSSRLNVTAGTNRFSWNMRGQGPWDKSPSRRFSNGPMVSPGVYQARLTVDGQTQTQSFNLLMDPRVEESGLTAEDVQAQESLSLQIADLISEAKKLTDGLQKERKPLSAKVKKGTASNVEKAREQQLAELEAELVTAEGRYQQPMLLAQMSYLYSMLNRADQRPGKDAYDRYEELKALFADLQKRGKALEIKEEGTKD